MPLRVADWYDAVREYEVKLIAGRAGLNLSVHRVHIIEKPEFSEFLEGNEIIFVTGVALSSPEELNEIIQNCYKAGDGLRCCQCGKLHQRHSTGGH